MPINRKAALKLIKQHGGVLVGLGANYDEFEMPWGPRCKLHGIKATSQEALRLPL